MSYETGNRPFYFDFAWAFDLLIDKPVRRECGAIAAWLVERGVLSGARLLDAGCGTGRYAAELSRRGYAVEGVDLSPALIAEASRAHAEAGGVLSFEVGDITTLPARRYDAILCRGVLNDLIGDRQRADALAAFRRALRDGGVLVLDVREWDATLERKRREPLFRKSVDTDRGKLTFTSVTSVDESTRRLVLAERHTLDDGHTERSAEYEFVMRCWTRDELDDSLRTAGFVDVEYFGAYDEAIAVGATDRMVAIATCNYPSRYSLNSRSISSRPVGK